MLGLPKVTIVQTPFHRIITILCIIVQSHASEELNKQCSLSASCSDWHSFIFNLFLFSIYHDFCPVISRMKLIKYVSVKLFNDSVLIILLQ